MGIDPGNRHSAYTIYDGGRDKLIKFDKIENAELKDDIYHLQDFYYVESIFIEGVQSYGMPVGKDVFETCYYIGRLQETIERIDVPYRPTQVLIHRSDIKMFWCHKTAKVKDSNITVAIVDHFDPQRIYGKYGKGVKKNPGPLFGMAADCWSSTAIAIYGYNQRIK